MVKSLSSEKPNKQQCCCDNSPTLSQNLPHFDVIDCNEYMTIYYVVSNDSYDVSYMVAGLHLGEEVLAPPYSNLAPLIKSFSPGV